MSGIAYATLVIGITPSYATLGIWATVIIAAAKTMQIFCFGGEYNGAGIYIVESVEKKNELLFGSFLSAAGLFGGLIASIMGIALTFQFLPASSWRISFILGAIIGLICVFYRKNLFENVHFKSADQKQHGLINLIRLFPLELLAGIFVGGASTVQITTVFIFIDPILMSKGYFSHHQLMILQFLLSFAVTIMLLLTAIVVRQKTPFKVMRFACFITTVCAYPLLFIIDNGNVFWVIISLTLLSVINELFFAPSNAYLKNLFPMQYRYRGASLSFCVGMSLFGGLTPVFENYLYRITGTFSIISIWIGFIYTGTFLLIYMIRQKQRYATCDSLYGYIL
jgi:MFS family permease